ncbi:MAG: calcium/sodium antiporter [Zhaonellaceae bacterium]|jgi:cation:H+ antiporter
MYHFLVNLNLFIVLSVLAISLSILSKAADLLVDNAARLSRILGLSQLIIGATIVSLGTTLPELSASVVAAWQGNGGFALGNAVGSAITNTSLILGVAALFGKIPTDKETSQKLTMLIAAIMILFLTTIPYKISNNSGLVPQWLGFVLLMFVPVYIFYLIKRESNNNSQEKDNNAKKSAGVIGAFIAKILLAGFVIAVSASALVASAEVLAERMGIPDVVISSTLVAFGTSVPELSTCIAAARSNHGGLAMGNILGANILNILFVTGASAALTPNGIPVPDSFYLIHFLGLAVVLGVFGFFAYNKKFHEISKTEGIILILIYAVYLATNILNTFY